MAVAKPFIPLDEKFPFDRQLGIAAAPLVLINFFTVVDPADDAGFLEAFKAAAEVITKQPGFISMQLHRAIGDSPTYLSYVVWESTDAVRAAFTDPAFLAKLPAYPSLVDPDRICFRRLLFPASALPDLGNTKIAMTGISTQQSMLVLRA